MSSVDGALLVRGERLAGLLARLVGWKKVCRSWWGRRDFRMRGTAVDISPSQRVGNFPLKEAVR